MLRVASPDWYSASPAFQYEGSASRPAGVCAAKYAARSAKSCSVSGSMIGAMIGIVALLRLEHRELLAQVGGVLSRKVGPFGVHAVAVGAMAGGADRGLGGARIG